MPTQRSRRRDVTITAVGLAAAAAVAAGAVSSVDSSTAAAASGKPIDAGTASAFKALEAAAPKPGAEPEIGERRGIVPARGQGRRLPQLRDNGDGHGHTHVTGHVDHGDQQWPPTPEGARGLRNLSDPDAGLKRAIARENAYAAVEARFDSFADTRALKSRRMTRLELIEVADKGSDAVRERRFQYFDRQANATVTVVEDSVTGALGVETTPATESQPEISQGEVEEAVALAKAYFTRQGESAAADLEGFGIQAYPASGTKLFNGRVVYVSLHVNADAPPDYVAWVDLSTQQVLESRKEVTP